MPANAGASGREHADRSNDLYPSCPLGCEGMEDYYRVLYTGYHPIRLSAPLARPTRQNAPHEPAKEGNRMRWHYLIILIGGLVACGSASPPTATATTTPKPTPTSTATPTSSTAFRIEIRKTWTTPGNAGSTTYNIDLVMCNQTSTKQNALASALIVGIATKGNTNAGRGDQPKPAPTNGFPTRITLGPNECGGGAVSITPRTTDQPISIYYRFSRDEQADSVPLNFP